MLHSTVGRVSQHTAGQASDQIRPQTEQNVMRIVAQGPAPIQRRLAELDREWDIERTLEANAAQRSC